MSRFTNEQPFAREAFIALFDNAVHDELAATLGRSGALGIVFFENVQMDSSQIGQRSGLIYGDGCTCKTQGEVLCCRLGDVPIRFQYPTH
jgi:hypothetical protein